MGCVISATNRVVAATTSDDLVRPPRNGFSEQATVSLITPGNASSSDLGSSDVVPGQAAATPSNDAGAARPLRGPARNTSQPNGAPEAAGAILAGIETLGAVAEPGGASGSDGGASRPEGAIPATSQTPGGSAAAVSSSRRDSSPRSEQPPPGPPGDATPQPAPSASSLAPQPRQLPLLLPPLQQRQQPAGETAPQLIPASLPALTDLLARISAPPPPPPQQQQQQQAVMDDRKLVLIIWDIENVRCPRGNDPLLSPAKVLGYIKAHFIHEPGREEWRTVAAVTPKSLGVIQKNYRDFVQQVVPELTLLVASADEPKRNADVMLKKELYRFVSEHAHIARHHPGQLTVVLISGDEDFLEPVQVALNSGFAVELLHHDCPSWALRSQGGYAREPLLWEDFLRQRSGAQQVKLPYRRR